MTVLNTEARLGMSTGQMPRVNLLPPEIAETAMLRKVQVSLGVGLVATVGVVGLLFVSACRLTLRLAAASTPSCALETLLLAAT